MADSPLPTLKCLLCVHAMLFTNAVFLNIFLLRKLRQVSQGQEREIRVAFQLLY